MKLSLRLFCAFAFALVGASAAATAVFGQADSLVGQITSSSGNTLVRDISGDGRFVVFESTGDLATQSRTERNNADGNIEVFLFDYAQRRIFQITNTTRALKNVTGSTTANNNIQVDVANTRPVISNDGRWIAFTSNAASSVTNNTNPGFFDGNFCPTATNCNVTASDGTNVNRPTLTALQGDGNNEIWLYRIPDAVVNAAVDLSGGANVPLLEATGGIFTPVTTSAASRPPVPGTDSQTALIRDDNFFPSINDDGTLIAFVSDRNYANENTGTNQNREIFVAQRTSDAGVTAVRRQRANKFGFAAAKDDASTNSVVTTTPKQITVTPRGSLTLQVFNTNPTIARNPAGGFRVAFVSTANNPLGGSGGNNGDANAEVFYINLNADGSRTNTFVQVTNTTDATPEQVSNLYSTGRRMSRDGRFIAYESLSTAPASNGAVDSNGYGLFVFDAASSTTRQVGARTFSDAGANGGDVRRFPVFTDYDANGAAPQVLVFASRLNYLANGSIATASGEGLNQNAARPVQIYSTPLDAATVNLTRISRIPAGSIAETQPVAANSVRRIAFSLLGTEVGGGNFDFSSEAYYLLTPVATTTATTGLTVFTGASARPVTVATPTPSVTPSPSPSPSVSPSPTTAPAPGLSRGSLAIVNLTAGSAGNSAVAATDYSARRFQLPIELAGVTVSVGNVAAGVYSVNRANNQVRFVVPIGLAAGSYTLTINDNGSAVSGTIQIIAAQPDVFTKGSLPIPQIGNPARAAVVNATNRVLQGEPFTVFTFPVKRTVRVPTNFRVYVTGVESVPASAITIQVGSQTASGSRIVTGAVATDQPGVYTIDFTLPPEAIGAGDVPITIQISNGASSSLADVAPRLFIL